jgi:hypothetical protein
MTTAQVAAQLATLCREGKFLEAIDALYAEGVVSVEARDLGDAPREMTGLAAVRGKNVWWFGENEIHAVTVQGPFVSPERFALHFHFDRTFKPTGQRSQFSEVAVYTVAGGRIVHEEFLYAEGD